jgi:hypothetical protein
LITDYVDLSNIKPINSKSKNDTKTEVSSDFAGDYLIIVTNKINLKESKNAFNVIYEETGTLEQRWRGSTTFTATTDGSCKGYDTKEYREDDLSCSLEYAVNRWTPSTNTIGVELDRDKLRNDGESIAYTFPSIHWNQAGYIFRWDEDGTGCDVDEVRLNFTIPHNGMRWITF